MISLGAQAYAQSPDVTAEPPAYSDRPVISLLIENDLFGGTDRNYTNGVRLEAVSAANDVHPLLDKLARSIPFIDLSDADLRQGVAIAHVLYTPSDISLDNPPADDRPYAGYLSGSFFVAARREFEQHTVQLDIGLVGPSAGGKFVQQNWHKMIDGQEPRGWDHQLHDELVFALSAQRMRRHPGPTIGPLETDMVLYSGLTLGSVRTHVSAGGSVRIGRDLGAEFAPPRLRPALGPSSLFKPTQNLGGYLFVGVGGYLVGRDLFLDGNTYRDSPRVDKRWVTGDVQAGAALYGGPWRASFTYVVRTEQFIGQDGSDQFGAIALTRRF